MKKGDVYGISPTIKTGSSGLVSPGWTGCGGSGVGGGFVGAGDFVGTGVGLAPPGMETLQARLTIRISNKTGNNLIREDTISLLLNQIFSPRILIGRIGILGV